MRILLIVLVAACASAPRRDLAHAVSSRDADAAASLFAETAEAELVAGPAVHGRPAIATALRWVFAQFPDTRLVPGRTWIAEDVRVVEIVWTATHGGRAIGIPGAVVMRLDAAGRIATARLYLDVPTLVGQLDATKLPAGARTRSPITAPIAGTAVITARGTSVEAANLALATRSWARLDAHDPAGVLADVAPEYAYDDLSGPAPLDAAGTRALLDGFLGLVGDFRITAKPTLFAAGDDVITESVEHMTFQGRSIVLHGLDIKHVVAGKVVREWQYANGAEVLAALFGVVLAVP